MILPLPADLPTPVEVVAPILSHPATVTGPDAGSGRVLIVDAAALSESPPAGAAAPSSPGHDASAPPTTEENQPIVVSGRPRDDPAEAVNIVSYKAVQAVDSALIRPVSMAYKAVLPSPARQGVHNVLTNLTEPVVFLNFLLQGKFGKAAVVVGRFAINSTLGIAGLMDVAAKKPFKLPYRKNNFADTLGFYGVGPGPYMFVPLVGPTTVRDLLGLLVDKAVVPFSFGGPFKTRYYALGNGVLSSLDYRVRYDGMITKQQQSENPYAAARKDYLDMRAAEVAALHTGKNAPKPANDAGGAAASPAAGSATPLKPTASPPQEPAAQPQPDVQPQPEAQPDTPPASAPPATPPEPGAAPVPQPQLP